MDIDRFIADHEAQWTELEELTRRAGSRRRRRTRAHKHRADALPHVPHVPHVPTEHRVPTEPTAASGPANTSLSAADVHRFVELYRTVSTHLSIARGRHHDAALTARLTALVSKAGAVIYGVRPPSWRAVGRFFTVTFPAALWHLRGYVIVATLTLMVPAIVVGTWLSVSEEALEVAAPLELREAYVGEEFEDYYSEQPSAQFASLVTTNNIQVGMMAFASGIAFAVPTLFVLAFNGANIGAAGGLFAAAGELPRFFGLLLPHGLLELTAIFVAGGTGLALGWTLISPGDRSRADAIAQQGRRAVVVVMGLALMFVVSGLIEGFVTGSALPTWVRLGIGALVEATFLVYVAVFGSRAAAAGFTGVVGEHAEAGWTPTTAPTT